MTAPMDVQDRPIDALLAGFAARSLSAPLAVLVASHLEIRPENRGFVAALDAAYGVFLDEIDPVPLAGRDRRLVNIFAAKDEPAAALARRAAASDGLLPPSLRRYLGRDVDRLEWRAILPGIKEAEVVRDGDVRASLIYGRPGRHLPRHGHSGLEAALVLKGVYSDATGRYRTGDIAVADEKIDHQPLVEGSEECMCFVVAHGPVRPSGLFGRLVQRVLGD